MHSTHFRMPAIVLALSWCASVHAQSPDEAIAFSRTVYNADGTARSTALYVTDAAGLSVRSLTPQADRVYDSYASWSPSGTHLTFSRYEPDRRSNSYLHVVDRNGWRSRQITRGRGDFDAPVWGPGSLIAFNVYQPGSGSCVGVIESSGRNQRILFCPGAATGTAASPDRAMWSADGATLYVPAGYYEGHLEPFWVALVYRVDVATGAATLLTRQVFTDSMSASLSPDGTAALYSDSDSITRVNFDDDVQVRYVGGHDPQYSPDGQWIAFSKRIFEPSPSFITHDEIFVMDANGGNVRQLTNEPIDYLEHRPVQWSKDGTRLLTQRTRYTDEGRTDETAMRIVDVATGGMALLPEGSASDWFEP